MSHREPCQELGKSLRCRPHVWIGRIDVYVEPENPPPAGRAASESCRCARGRFGLSAEGHAWLLLPFAKSAVRNESICILGIGRLEPCRCRGRESGKNVGQPPELRRMRRSQSAERALAPGRNSRPCARVRRSAGDGGIRADPRAAAQTDSSGNTIRSLCSSSSAEELESGVIARSFTVYADLRCAAAATTAAGSERTNRVGPPRLGLKANLAAVLFRQPPGGRQPEPASAAR